MTILTRRTTLQLLGGSAAAAALGSPLAAGKMSELNFAGSPSPMTLYMAHMAQQPEITALADTVNFQQWRSPDMLIAMVKNEQIQVSSTPSNTAAMLYNKGVPIQLLDITTWGTLHLLTRRDDIKGLADLKGKSLMLFFRGAMPDIVTRYLAGKQGLDLDKDVDLSYASTPMEGVQMFMAGKAETIILSEPAVTAATVKSMKAGKPVNTINLQEVWTEVTGRPRMPQAGTLIHSGFAAANPEAVELINAGIKASVDWMNNDKDAAADLGAAKFGLSKPIVRKSLENIHMEWVSAREAREELEFFYSALYGLSPKLIGGKLPDDGFYLG